MNDAEAREALRGLTGFEHGEVRQIHGGWAYFTFAVEPDWIFRFPRNPVVARDLAREQRLLPVVSRHVPFAVPRFEWIGRFRERPFAGYRRIPGRPLRSDDVDDVLAVELAHALDALHSVPRGPVRQALGVEGSCEEWRARYAELRELFSLRIAPLLSEELAAAALRGFGRFLERDSRTLEQTVLVHNDLGTEHLLVDPSVGRLVGIIDFEEAGLGDPAIDLVGLWLDCGLEVMEGVLRATAQHGSEPLRDRMRFYAWMSAVHTMLFALEEDRPQLFEDGVRALRLWLVEAGLLG